MYEFISFFYFNYIYFMVYLRVYLVYDLDYGIVAAKISVKDEKIQRVWEACVNIQKYNFNLYFF